MSQTATLMSGWEWNAITMVVWMLTIAITLDKEAIFVPTIKPQIGQILEDGNITLLKIPSHNISDIITERFLSNRGHG